MIETYEMSWKPPKRTLQNVPKVKLPSGHPLPENVDDVSNACEFVGDVSGRHIPFQRNESCIFSELGASLPIASQSIEDGYLNNFEGTSIFGLEGDSDLEQVLLSDFGETDGSSFDDSSASFFSWTDEFEAHRASKDKDLFEELETALYDEETPSVQDEELSSECVAWKSRHVYLRLVGQKPCYTYENIQQVEELENESSEEENEIIESHGYCEDPPKTEASIASSDSMTVQRFCSGKMIDKVKITVLDQLAFFALSEALKSFEDDHNVKIRSGNNVQPSNIATSSLANLSEDLGRALQISGRSMHQMPKSLSTEHGKISPLLSGPETIHLRPESKRFTTNINAIPEDNIFISSSPSFSVLGARKPLIGEGMKSKTKLLEKRGFHSAADRKKPGVVGRRYSCVSPDHDKLLKFSNDSESSGQNCSLVANPKQVSAPNTPLKLLRHLTLPPIQNLNSYKFSVDSEKAVQQSFTNVRRIFVKNKVSLSPLPTVSNVPDQGFPELQLARKLLNTSDANSRNSRRKSGAGGVKNLKTRMRINKLSSNR